MKEKRGRKEPKNKVEIAVHRKKHEILWMFRKFARERDEQGFRDYLVNDCGIERNDERFSAALREFWNLVRAYERKPHS